MRQLWQFCWRVSNVTKSNENIHQLILYSTSPPATDISSQGSRLGQFCRSGRLHRRSCKRSVGVWDRQVQGLGGAVSRAVPSRSDNLVAVFSPTPRSCWQSWKLVWSIWIGSSRRRCKPLRIMVQNMRFDIWHLALKSPWTPTHILATGTNPRNIIDWSSSHWTDHVDVNLRAEDYCHHIILTSLKTWWHSLCELQAAPSQGPPFGSAYTKSKILASPWNCGVDLVSDTATPTLRKACEWRRGQLHYIYRRCS